MAAALREAERDHAEARAERERSGEELTASQILFANADRHEREAQEWAERDWNSGDFDGADIADLQEFERRDDDRTQTAEATGQSRAEGDDAGLDYDSSERRRQFAASLEGKADQKTIDARILADGQAPSNYPDFAAFLVQEGIDSISLNPDSFMKTVGSIAAAEATA